MKDNEMHTDDDLELAESVHDSAAAETVADEPAVESAGVESAGVESVGVESVGVESAVVASAEPHETRHAIEAILMVADQPVDVVMLAQLVELPTASVAMICHEMATAFEQEGRGFQLIEVAGGWRFQSHPEQAPYVERFALDGQVSRLSAAALETLAIVAYKQPISRAQIAQIRGVNVDGVMRTLTQRGYVAEIGIDPGPGQATLFGTTSRFLEGLGMASIGDLAPLADFVPGAEIMEALEAGLRVDNAVDVTLDAPTEVVVAEPEPVEDVDDVVDSDDSPSAADDSPSAADDSPSAEGQ
jgi:segregation and condensation protein B